MAQTRKRRRKHRGTQGGKVDQRRSRPRSRAEARSRAKSRGGSKKTGGQRQVGPPTWRSAINRGLVAAALFFALMALAFKRPLLQAFSLAAFMLVFYIPIGYFIDSIMYRRRQASQQRERAKRAGGDA
jgi:hypothetical protein